MRQQKVDILIKKRKSSFHKEKKNVITKAVNEMKSRLLKKRVDSVSQSDWSHPVKRATSLKNLTLLKQYLTFISKEVDKVTLSDNKVHLTISKPVQSPSSYQLGATLIEAYVHDQRQEDGVTEHQQKMNDDCIRCICDSPNEEYGDMVQCDDCLLWLHLDCLHLNQDALKERFRCPSCILSLGDETNKVSSSLSWRYAAQLKSKYLASKEDDDDDMEEEEVAMDTESSSQVTTPSEPFLKDIPPFLLDHESLTILSHIAYIQSIDTVRKEIFAPNATDVFLYENATSNIPLLTLDTPRFTPNAPPSDVCTQDLSEYSGFFLEPIL